MKLPKTKGLRFGQLLVIALEVSRHLRSEEWEDIDDDSTEQAYVITGKDLFYLENDELEKILNDYVG